MSVAYAAKASNESFQYRGTYKRKRDGCTSRDQDQGSPGVHDTDSRRLDRRRAQSDRLVNTPGVRNQRYRKGAYAQMILTRNATTGTFARWAFNRPVSSTDVLSSKKLYVRKGQRPRELSVVDASESNLAVHGDLTCRWLKRHGNNVLLDVLLGEEIVCHWKRRVLT